MSRFFVSSESISGNTITIEGEEAHHIINVMRLKPSDEIVAFDGSGKEYIGTIRHIKGKMVLVDISRTRTPMPGKSVAVTLLQAIPKKAKMDYIVEKATELGATCVMPVFTKRTIPDWDEGKKASCVTRWRKIALEASKQCSRPDLPEVSEIKDFKEALCCLKKYDLMLIATLSDDVIGLRDALEGFSGCNVIMAIGPEGDFTPDEVAAAKAAGFKAVSLGLRVLKSDTAGLAALAMLDYALTQ